MFINNNRIESITISVKNKILPYTDQSGKKSYVKFRNKIEFCNRLRFFFEPSLNVPYFSSLTVTFGGNAK